MKVKLKITRFFARGCIPLFVLFIFFSVKQISIVYFLKLNCNIYKIILNVGRASVGRWYDAKNMYDA